MPAPYSKLHSLVIGKVDVTLTLKEIAAFLEEQTRLRDPDGEGIKFRINPLVVDLTVNPDRGSRIALPKIKESSLEDLKVRVAYPFENGLLKFVLQQIETSPDNPIQYKVEENAIEFSQAPAAIQLFVKTYKVDPQLVAENLKSGLSAELADSETRLALLNKVFNFQKKDILTDEDKVTIYLFLSGFLDLPPNSLSYNVEQGLLSVRTTLNEFELVDHVVKTLNTKS